MKTRGCFNFTGKLVISAVVVVVFAVVTFLNFERRDHEADLKLIKSGDLVMCTAEKIPAGTDNQTVILHIVEAMTVMENAVETRKLHGFLLNNNTVRNGVVGYEELNSGCKGVMFVPAKSEEERDIARDITTKGLPLAIVYSDHLPLRSF